MNLDISPFRDDFFLANTPAYLLRKTIANPRLESALAKYQDGDLMKLIDKGDTADASSADTVAAYIALIGLMKRRSLSLLNDLRLRSPAYLRWLPVLLADWDDTRHADNSVDLKFEQKLNVKSFPSGEHE